MAGPVRVHGLLERLELNRESVLVIRGDTLVTGDAAARRRRRGRGPPGHLRGCVVKCRRCRQPGGDRAAPPQRRVLRRLLPPPLPRAGAAHDRRLRHDRAGRAGAGRRVGRQGLARLWDILLDLGVRRRRALPRPRASASTATSPARTRAPFADRARRRRSSRSTCPTDYGFDIPTGARAARRAPCSACGLSKRHLFNQAARRRRLRRRRHRPQPRRRGGRAVRQRAAVGDRLPRPPAARAARRRRVRAQGEAAGAAGRAGDGGVLRAAGHRLHRRGVPDGGGQQAPRATRRRSTPSRTSRPGPRPRSTSASSTACRRLFTPAARDGAARTCRPARRAARRRPARSARSASWSTGPRTATDDRAGLMRRAVPGRRPGAARRLQAAPLPRDAAPRAASSTPTPGSCRHDELIGQRRGRHRAVDRGRALHRACARRSRTSC